MLTGQDAPAWRRATGRLGMILTTSLRQRVSLFNRSRGLLDHNFYQCAVGNPVKARM